MLEPEEKQKLSVKEYRLGSTGRSGLPPSTSKAQGQPEDFTISSPTSGKRCNLYSLSSEDLSAGFSQIPEGIPCRCLGMIWSTAQSLAELLSSPGHRRAGQGPWVLAGHRARGSGEPHPHPWHWPGSAT